MRKTIQQIIKAAPKRMQSMLYSVYNFNSSLTLSRRQERLLEKILFAMSVVDRKFFIGTKYSAYDDNPAPIGKGQTISQPSTVARMLVLAELDIGDSVLDVGSGSGWNACLASFLVYPGQVISIEKIASLIENSRANLKKLLN